MCGAKETCWNKCWELQRVSILKTGPVTANNLRLIIRKRMWICALTYVYSYVYVCMHVCSARNLYWVSWLILLAQKLCTDTKLNLLLRIPVPSLSIASQTKKGRRRDSKKLNLNLGLSSKSRKYLLCCVYLVLHEVNLFVKTTENFWRVYCAILPPPTHPSFPSPSPFLPQTEVTDGTQKIGQRRKFYCICEYSFITVSCCFLGSMSMLLLLLLSVPVPVPL